MKDYVVVSLYVTKSYLHVYGPYEKSKAKAVRKEIEDEAIRSLGDTEFRKQIKVWVKKLIDI